MLGIRAPQRATLSASLDAAHLGTHHHEVTQRKDNSETAGSQRWSEVGANPLDQTRAVSIAAFESLQREDVDAASRKRLHEARPTR